MRVKVRGRLALEGLGSVLAVYRGTAPSVVREMATEGAWNRVSAVASVVVSVRAGSGPGTHKRAGQNRGTRAGSSQ